MNSGQFPQVVINVLIKCSKAVAVLADRVWVAVKFMYLNNYPFTTITPSLVKQTLKSNQASCNNFTKAKKFNLLHYCLEDRNYNDLPGLALLPVVNNTFAAFGYNYSTNKFYVCDQAFLKAQLLANNEAVLVNVEAEDSILHQKLAKLASSNYTQLQTLTIDAIAMILR